jgi:hypothetical protein
MLLWLLSNNFLTIALKALNFYSILRINGNIPLRVNSVWLVETTVLSTVNNPNSDIQFKE